jgi:bis(5'-nucleosyl)-tetraphosphatase (symmetrical)
MIRSSRTIIVGDIHGCIEEFEEIIKLTSYDKAYDRLILLGDLIDRGPDSVAVVRKAREMGLESVMGNHEYKFLKWYRSNGKNYDSQEYYANFSDEDINYIAQMPTSIKIDDTIIVHAGLRPGIPLEKQSKDDLMYLRYIDSNQKFVSLKKISKIGKELAEAHFWTEFWTGPESIVYGHNVSSMETPLIEEIYPGTTCYGLDTGCCFGGKLTALILETKEIVQVQAKQTYYQSRFTI